MTLTKRQREIVDRLKRGWVVKQSIDKKRIVVSPSVYVNTKSLWITKKTLSWMIDSGVVGEPEKFGYWTVYMLKDDYNGY